MLYDDDDDDSHTNVMLSDLAVNSQFPSTQVSSNFVLPANSQYQAIDSNLSTDSADVARGRSSSFDEFSDSADEPQKSQSCFGRLKLQCKRREREQKAREIHQNGNGVNELDSAICAADDPGLHTNSTTMVFPYHKYPPNVVNNQKYSVWSFLPVFLYNEFRFFFNMYFLLVALSQLIPILQIGFQFTYIAPLLMVLAFGMVKEIRDDQNRYRQDRNVNKTPLTVLQFDENSNTVTKQVTETKNIKVGDLLYLEPNSVIPCDCILLWTETSNVYLKTDQLDGETDLKARRAPTLILQLCSEPEQVARLNLVLRAEAPKLDIYDFNGNVVCQNSMEALSLENTLWKSTTIMGRAVAIALYTGADTRIVLNSGTIPNKVGYIDTEINFLCKILFCLTVLLSVLMVLGGNTSGTWYIQVFRYILLFSSIIPISMRVNMDLGKMIYSMMINRDENFHHTTLQVVAGIDTKMIARNSTIPEDLGCISVLVTDKTGTLTTNTMIFKALQLVPPLCYTDTDVNMLKSIISGSTSDPRYVETMSMLETLVLCHNVTALEDESGKRHYEGSSPDEVALVEWVASVGLELISNDNGKMVVRTPRGVKEYTVLQSFPFTSQTKRMSVIVQSPEVSDGVQFLTKGAESVILKSSVSAPWVDDELLSLARKGLRTLVFARKTCSLTEYHAFEKKLSDAKSVLSGRQAAIDQVVAKFEPGTTVQGISAMEDQLQPNIRATLELLREGEVRLFMLTGDKAETAEQIGYSSRQVRRGEELYKLQLASNRADMLRELQSVPLGACLLIDGSCLQEYLALAPAELVRAVSAAPSAIVCRCAPKQKALFVSALKAHTSHRVAAIGDGGNDVAMLKAADVGIGLVGKEGAQAALAGDYQLLEFQHLVRLLFWHGRNSYLRSSALSQFVMHRGLIISVIQAVFSAMYFFAAVPLYTGWIMVGYTSIFTMLPVIAITLNTDVTENHALQYPQLYAVMKIAKPLSLKTFFEWLMQSIFQGGTIMVMGVILFESAFIRIVSITFTALVIVELLNIAVNTNTWTKEMVIAQIISILAYIACILLLPDYFDLDFILTLQFLYKTGLIVAVTITPVLLHKLFMRCLAPQIHIKLNK